MVASLLLDHGPSALVPLLIDLEAALEAAGLASVEAARGLLSLGPEGAAPGAERAAYLSALLGAASSVRRR